MARVLRCAVYLLHTSYFAAQFCVEGRFCCIFGAEANLIVLHRVGVFATLTNSYALVAVGASENFYRYAHLS